MSTRWENMNFIMTKNILTLYEVIQNLIVNKSIKINQI